MNPQLWLLLEVNKDLFLGIILGITEVFGPDGSFAAPAGFPIATNGLIWLFKGKRLPTPGLGNHESKTFFFYFGFHLMFGGKLGVGSVETFFFWSSLDVSRESWTSVGLKVW